MKFLGHQFYIQPMNMVHIEGAILYLIWLALMLILRGRARRITACFGVVLSLVLVISFTIIGRKGFTDIKIGLIPIIFRITPKTNPEIFRSMFMNVLLFLPFGFSLPFAMEALPMKIKRPVLTTIAAGFALSLIVEIIQLVYKLGEFEVDDLIMNTLGAVIGATVFPLVGFISSKFLKHRKI